MPEENKVAPESLPADAEELAVCDSFEVDESHVEILADHQRLTAHIRVTPPEGGKLPAASAVLEILRSKGLRLTESAAPDTEEAFEKAPQGAAVGPLHMAEGVAPVDGHDGSCAWLVARPDIPRTPKTPGAKVDHKERNPIVNVRRGQKLISITPPTEGSPGTDVFGAAIACKQGQPADIRRGRNVDFDEGASNFIALTSGYIEVVDNSLSVEPVFTVKGNVDLTVGNIDFIGPVKINGDVLDGFQVKAGEEIEVGGTVEGALLEAGGLIDIKGGVTGKGKGRITAKGPIEARYLNEVYVEAAGDIKVHNSIIASTVKSLGRIDVLSGAIRGSNVVAKKGLHSPEIGSETGVRTIVVVGVDYDVKDKLVTLEREMSVVKEMVYKIQAALGPLLDHGEIIESLPKEKAAVAKKLVTQLEKLAEREETMTETREKLMAEMQVDEDVCIEIDKKLLQGVVMQIGACRRTFEEEVPGPLRLFPDPENSTLRVSR